MRMCHIWGPKWSICPKQTFFWKTIKTVLIYLLAPFIVENFKKILPSDPELWGSPILGLKMSHSPNENFFRKPVNEPCFFHSCLTTCQKSKSDINLLVKYWQLKNTEISLTAFFGYNLKTRFFPGMQFLQNLNEP